MYLYAIGDKVTVRKDLDSRRRYYMLDGRENNTVNDDMLDLAGQEVTIKNIVCDQYIVEESAIDWRWTDEMFENTRKICKDDCDTALLLTLL